MVSCHIWNVASPNERIQLPEREGRTGDEENISAQEVEELLLHLERAGLARQKWPEEVHAVGDFPRTASGKVQKFVLRKSIAGAL
jgi:acyl-CoA synthetase (AMP-forming)/AMP-acid ligase II